MFLVDKDAFKSLSKLTTFIYEWFDEVSERFDEASER